MQLGRTPDDPVDEPLLAFYRRLVAIVGDEAFHDGDWRLLDVVSAWDATYEHLVAWRWKRRGELRVVVVNFGDRPAQAHVVLADDLPRDASEFVFHDVLNDTEYPWARAALESAGGIFVRLNRGESHIFNVVANG